MKQLEAYLQSSIPEPTRVFGLQLQPFSLGHYNLMRRYGLTFLEGVADSKAESFTKYIHDFFLAVIICSMTYEENVEAWNYDRIKIRREIFGFEYFTKSQLSRFLVKWNRKLERAFNSGEINALKELCKFKDYCESAFVFPKFVEGTAENNTRSGASWSQSLYTVLVKELNYTPSEALNLPLAQGFFEWCKYAENNGIIELVSDRELELIDELKKESNGI